MWTNDKIIMIEDMSAPPAMAGKKGDVKVIDIDIPLYYAKLAVKGGHARQVKDDAEIRAVRIELGLIKDETVPEPKKKTKRKETTKDVRKGKGNQKSDTR